ncbi:hypothetical protein Tco_1346189 [Tanacetum coccineum]
MAIRGIFNNGTCCTDPGLVKEAFFNHFADRFKEPANYRCKINFQFPKKLDSSQAEDLERIISSDEIRSAVWNCGDNKSPGPDGYSFEFLRKKTRVMCRLQDYILKDVRSMLDEAFLPKMEVPGISETNVSFRIILPGGRRFLMT